MSKTFDHCYEILFKDPNQIYEKQITHDSTLKEHFENLM